MLFPSVTALKMCQSFLIIYSMFIRYGLRNIIIIIPVSRPPQAWESLALTQVKLLFSPALCWGLTLSFFFSSFVAVLSLHSSLYVAWRSCQRSDPLWSWMNFRKQHEHSFHLPNDLLKPSPSHVSHLIGTCNSHRPLPFCMLCYRCQRRRDN